MGDDPAKFRRASGRPFQHEDDLRLLLHVEVGCAVAGLSVNRFCETFPFRDSQGRRFHKATLKRRYYQRKARSEEHTSELQSLMRISYAVFCLKKKKKQNQTNNTRKTKRTDQS